ncbi:MAG: hypothetical protein QW343_04140 [Candidatus Norongarragalinales archaeon]
MAVRWREFKLSEVAAAHETITNRAKALKGRPAVKLWAAPSIAGIEFKIVVETPLKRLVAPELANVCPQGVRTTQRQTYTLFVPTQNLPEKIRTTLSGLPSKQQVLPSGHLWRITDEQLLLEIVRKKIDSNTENKFQSEIARIAQEAAERINKLRAR